MFRNEKKRAQRRAWPIHGYVGPNGGGKSAAMVWDTLPSLAAGRPVLSTVRILDFNNPRECEGCDEEGHYRPVYGPVKVEDLAGAALHPDVKDSLMEEFLAADEGRPSTAEHRGVTHDELGFPVREVVDYVTHRAAHPLYVEFREWEQLLESRMCDILMDEVTGVASSRESQAMPAPIANKLVQLRRADVVVRWSAPSWARADKIMRECSQAVTYCRGYLPKHVPVEGEDRQWRQRRLFSWKTYDATDFEDFTSGKREQLSVMTGDLHWGPGSPSFSAYDTYDAVSFIGTVTDGGRCFRCSGRREIPKCRCGDSPSSTSPGAGAGGKAGGLPRREPLPVAAGITPESLGTPRTRASDQNRPGADPSVTGAPSRQPVSGSAV